MKTNVKLLALGVFLLLLPRIYYHFISQDGGIDTLLALASAGTGLVLIAISLSTKKSYKPSDLKTGKVFRIKSIYNTPWESRLGIRFKNKEGMYYVSPIPKELLEASCGEKYQKTKNGIIKI